ncbi:5,6-dimethylbenzimidazole synthase [Actinomycetospora soli]|uniref:5,6-dimethylbenzimidazole synthase n=1 Tax=Actinomycetospora soli TaxID=2893887 RepID=UPI001E32F65B|nr:5,6-dimethylbenzimidazole synthase [Actinomycetospora soli]MCD2188375.1 5,6-dimethylbenzimidazole synthase [Actinomycetospora soli]
MSLERGDAEALYRVLSARRDVRTGFTAEPVDDAALRRVLAAAHTAPSVGFSQPWDFLVVRDAGLRDELADLAAAQRAAFAASLPAARARAFAGLKVEAIREAPLGVVVTCDPTRGGRHVLGRATQPRMAAHSVAGAVQNLWLAARAEGLGVGWVSFFREREMAALLGDRVGLPQHLEIVAYLCLGHVSAFADGPELETAGWARRRPLEWAVHEGRWGAHPGGDALDDALTACAALSTADGETAARERLTRMTVPPGALGQVAELGVRLSGLAGSCPPPVPEPAVVAVFAGDHGVHAQGVTPWPQDVTHQMVANFLAGGAAVNAFAHQVGAEVVVVDVGVAAPLDEAPGLLPRKVRPGTADMTVGPAMSREEARAAVVAGVEVARDLVAAGNRLLVTGDMGIANTTASAALVSAFTGASPEVVTGRGTGIDDAMLARKAAVVRTALSRHGLLPDAPSSPSTEGHPQSDRATEGPLRPGRGGPAAVGEGRPPADRPTEGPLRPGRGGQAVADDPLGALAAVGGLEIAGIAGLLLGGAALRTPVVVDGVVAGAAALVAAALAPTASQAWIAGHRSVEPAHTLALTHLGLEPVLDLGMRVGEGTGALLAAPLVAAAARALAEVATFDSAGVAEKTEEISQ